MTNERSGKGMGFYLERGKAEREARAELIAEKHPTPSEGVTVLGTEEGRRRTAEARDLEGRKARNDTERARREAERELPRPRGIGRYLPEDRRTRGK